MQHLNSSRVSFLTDPSKRLLLEQLTDILVESQNTSSRYIWNPFQKLSDEVQNTVQHTQCSRQKKCCRFLGIDNRQASALRKEILDTFRQLHDAGKKIRIGNNEEL